MAGILPASAHAATLAPNDYVGISFWLISMALIAATAFFFIETTRVEGKWENVSNSIWSGNVGCCSTLLLYARCMGINR